MKKNSRVIIVVGICAILCVGYYYYISNTPRNKEEVLTEIEKVTTIDIDSSYPTTPREVIKLYNRILKCIYNDADTEEELKKLNKQARKLMDEELLANNPETEHYTMLEADVKEFLEDGMDISAIRISAGNEVEHRQVDGRECAYVEATYILKNKKKTKKAGQTYILRRDDDKNWKVLGYYLPE